MKPPPNMVKIVDAAADRLVKGKNTFSCNALAHAEGELIARCSPCARYAMRWMMRGAERNGVAACPDDRLGHRLLWLVLLRHFAEIGEKSP